MNVGVFVLGVVLVIGGLFMYGYARSIDGLYFAPPNNPIERPYAGIGFVVLIIGVVLMIAGAVSSTQTKRVVTDEVIEPHPKKRTVVKEEKI